MPRLLSAFTNQNRHEGKHYLQTLQSADCSFVCMFYTFSILLIFLCKSFVDFVYYTLNDDSSIEYMFKTQLVDYRKNLSEICVICCVSKIRMLFRLVLMIFFVCEKKNEYLIYNQEYIKKVLEPFLSILEQLQQS